MTALNMARHRNNPNFAFWKMLKEGYDDFEATHQEPQVAVCEKRYVFDATSEDGKPIRSNPSGACPAYRLDPTVASTVHEYRQKEQIKMANYISQRVATVAPHEGDGGMNPVFATELAHPSVDGNGRYTVASASVPDTGSYVPGALPHVPNPPGTTIPKVGKPQPPAVASQPAPAAEPASQPPVVMASVRLPTPAPQPKEGQAPEETQKPANIASLFGNLFGGSHQESAPAPTQTAQAAPVQPEQPNEQVALRGTNTEMAAKPHRVEQPTRVASAPISLQPKAQRVAAQANQDSVWDQPKRDSVWDQAKPAAKPEPAPAAPKPAAVAKAEPVAKPHVKVASASKPPAPAPEREIRTAYSGTTTGSGLLTGAQPVVPAGSFNSFR